MKILAVFLDMMGGSYLRTINADAQRNPMDDLMEEYGGTVYKNCFTPAPDTPRSSACMWTGTYPRTNNCSTRLKYPGDFLNPDLEHIWKILYQKNYDVNIFMRREQERIGLIPLTGHETVFHKSIYEFFDHVTITDNSFHFFYLPDFHKYNDDYHYTKRGFSKGSLHAAGLIRTIFEHYDIKNTFDYTIVFSDHGFRIVPQTRHRHLIESDRTKTLMWLISKGSGPLSADEKLRSNLDVMPTICEMIGYQTEHKAIDGISLLSERGHDYVFIEDHDSFEAHLGMIIEHWAVVTADIRYHWLEIDGKFTHEQECMFDETFFEELVREKMCDYDKIRPVYKILSRYRENIITADIYSDGTPYKKHNKLHSGFYRIYAALLRRFYKMTGCL